MCILKVVSLFINFFFVLLMNLIPFLGHGYRGGFNQENNIFALTIMGYFYLILLFNIILFAFITVFTHFCQPLIRLLKTSLILISFLTDNFDRQTQV